MNHFLRYSASTLHRCACVYMDTQVTSDTSLDASHHCKNDTDSQHLSLANLDSVIPLDPFVNGHSLCTNADRALVRS